MKYLFVFGLMFYSLSGIAQPLQNHFVYLQTENKQPFYVKMNSAILSSTSTGYLIVPKLLDSTYQFIIGFPANEWPEQSISLPVKKDAGFLLKNFQEKGWGLFNLQTFEVVMNSSKTKGEPEQVVTSSDQFSTMLSEVVNDSSILKTAIPQKIAPSQNQAKSDSAAVATIPAASVKDSTLPKVIIDSSSQKTTVPQKITPPQNQAKIDSPAVATILPAKVNDTSLAVKQTSIEKLTSKKNNYGLEITFFDLAETDTIKATFDLGADTGNIRIDSSISEAGSKKQDTTAANKTETMKTKVSRQVTQSVEELNSTKKNTSTQTEFLDVKKTSMINSNCKQNAIETDLQKLEKKMVSESNDDDKIKVAKKIFKTKCFTTSAIKQLSKLFITSAGKYNFYDMAYPFASDSGLYYSLESELLDAYYIKRFQALINK
ncbi:MAG: DUF4476 domain-containing protein [Ginsengibacter sp.]